MDDELITNDVIKWADLFIRLSMQNFFRYLRGAGLSLAQMNVLMFLYYKGPTEVMTFAQYMDLSPAGASQLIDRMVHQNLVDRETSHSDKRVRMVIIKPLGRAIIEESTASRHRLMTDLLSSLDVSEKQSIATALQILIEKTQQLENFEN